ncbi:AB hydrolase superfamily protein YdjP [compost metagenome]|jgi:pimeloyl-ACP methyl ester carboxylesterase
MLLFMSKRELKLSKIRIGDISISYYIRPSTTYPAPKTVLFIHGFPFNKNTWKQQLLDLDEEYTGIALDVRGHGLSTNGHGFFSVDVFAKDLVEFIRKLDLNHIVLCGISMGGYIALRTYELIGQQLAGLILCDTNSLADDNKGKQKRFDSIQALLKYGRRPFAIGFTENVFYEKTIRENPEAVELIKSCIRRNELSSICSTQLALASRTDTTHSLKTIIIPTLVIKGKHDKLMSEEQTSILIENIPDVRFMEFEESGHLPNLEEPEKFNRVLNEFLASI